MESKDLLRDTFLNFVDDGQIARYLAAEDYNPQGGASLLLWAVDHEIRARLAKAWYRKKVPIVDEMMEEPLPNYDVSVAATSEDESEFAVRRIGIREIQLQPEVS